MKLLLNIVPFFILFLLPPFYFSHAISFERFENKKKKNFTYNKTFGKGIESRRSKSMGKIVINPMEKCIQKVKTRNANCLNALSSERGFVPWKNKKRPRRPSHRQQETTTTTITTNELK